MKAWRVHLCGGDESGWALDEDLELTRRALGAPLTFCGLDEAEVVHSVWWEPLLRIPADRLAGKRIICHCSGEPYRYLQIPDFIKARDLVGLWIAQSTQAKRQMDAVGIPNAYVPYALDASLFHPLGKGHPDLEALRAEWSIPKDRYLVGNFQRDTEGSDLTSPKLVKGPDVFLEIVRALLDRGAPIHVVIGGPRRHWLRHRLKECGVPAIFIGREIEGDDYDANRLTRETVNKLYQLLDLCIVSSRSEGGPRPLLEAPAAGCRVVSSRVGLAEDLLPASWIYDSPIDAIPMIHGDAMRTHPLPDALPEVQERIRLRYSPAANAPLFQAIYRDLERIAPFALPSVSPFLPSPTTQPGLLARVGRRVLGRNAPPPLCVGLWHKFFKPPYGGGNQFMLALRKGLAARGVKVVENAFDRAIQAFVLNSIHFDVERLTAFQEKQRVPVLHRIDGPIFLIRGHDREKDELCYELNRRFADATVLQSRWTWERIVETGHHPVRGTIVINAVDPDIFHSSGRSPFDRLRKIRLISSSWSDNPRKGGPLYQWLDRHLDWDRFEYTFVGNSSEPFERIRRIPPVPSEALADELRRHDIYITASQNDPCSNAVIEALACGLPVLYLNQGGHPELVGLGGLPFTGESDVLRQLDRIVENYEILQRLIVAPSFESVVGKYEAILRQIAGQT